MTVATSTSQSGPYVGAGQTGPFTIGFRFLEDSHLLVTKLNTATQGETTLVLNVDYTVTGAGDASGTLTLTTALAVGYTLTIVRNVPITQEIDYVAGDPFPADSHEDGLDKLTMIAQQLNQSLTGSLRIPEATFALNTLPDTATRANKVIAFDSNGQPTVAIPVSGSAADVLTQLANGASAAQGSALVAHNPALAYAASTAGAAIQHGALALSQFSGADPTGVADSTAAINAALSAATTLRTRLLVDGRYRHTAQITVPAKAAIVGCGWTSDKSAAGRSQSCFIKDFNGVGFLFSGDDASTDGVQYDSTAAKTGDIIQVTGSRVRLLRGATTNGGNDGVRIGKTEAGASSINANCGVIREWISLGNARDGINFDHTNTSTSGTFPLGAPDCNAWDVSHVLCGSTGAGNGRDGIRVANCIDNKFSNIVAQVNTGNSMRFTTSARGHLIVGSYSESNTAGGVLFDSGAKNNVLIGTSMVITGQVTVDNDGSNLIVQQTVNSGINAPFWNFLKIANQAAGGFADVTLHADVNSIDAARVRGSQSSGTRGKLTLQTRTNGNVLTDRLTIDGEVRAVFSGLSEGVLINKQQADTTTPGVNINGVGGRIDSVNSGTGAATVTAHYNGNGFVGGISTSGTSTTYATSSARALKKNIRTARGSGEVIDALRVRSFEWKTDGSHVGFGFIAQEVHKVFPAAVVVGKKPREWAGDWSKLVPLLVAEVQELRARLARIEGK